MGKGEKVKGVCLLPLLLPHFPFYPLLLPFRALLNCQENFFNFFGESSGLGIYLEYRTKTDELEQRQAGGGVSTRES